MNRFQSLALAAAVLAPVMLPLATPAAAGQGLEISATRPFTSRHHAVHVGRRATVRVHRPTRIAAIPANVACGGPWCRREFVLMLGIGF